jgi:hypothetical protein
MPTSSPCVTSRPDSPLVGWSGCRVTIPLRAAPVAQLGSFAQPPLGQLRPAGASTVHAHVRGAGAVSGDPGPAAARPDRPPSGQPRAEPRIGRTAHRRGLPDRMGVGYERCARWVPACYPRLTAPWTGCPGTGGRPRLSGAGARHGVRAAVAGQRGPDHVERDRTGRGRPLRRHPGARTRGAWALVRAIVRRLRGECAVRHDR